MRIGIDIDDTVAALMDAVLAQVKKVSHVDVAFEELTSKGKLPLITGRSRDDLRDIMHTRWNLGYVEETEDGAWFDVLTRLVDAGHEVYFVSYRPTKSHAAVAKWLEGIPHNGLIFLNAKEGMKKFHLPFDVFVDDTPAQFITYDGKRTAPRPVYVVAKPWNEDYVKGGREETKRVERVASLVEALERLEKGVMPC